MSMSRKMAAGRRGTAGWEKEALQRILEGKSGKQKTKVEERHGK